MFDSYRAEVQFAMQAVREAAAVCRLVQQELVVQAVAKEDQSPVTVADFAAQAIVARGLTRSFPSDPLVAEEDSGALRKDPALRDRVAAFAASQEREGPLRSVLEWIEHGNGQPDGRFWTLDPIDGTKGFLRGGQYAVALALLVEGRVAVGALACPGLGSDLEPAAEGEGALLIAVRGQGAYVGRLFSTATSTPGTRGVAPLSTAEAFTRLRVSSINSPPAARLLRSFESAHTSDDGGERFGRKLGLTAPAVRLDSQAKYAMLAGGKAEILLRLLSPRQPDYQEKIWDQAAGSIILEEAGGTITDLEGRPLDFTAGRTLARNRGVLATNGHLHDASLEALRTVSESLPR